MSQRSRVRRSPDHADRPDRSMESRRVPDLTDRGGLAQRQRVSGRGEYLGHHAIGRLERGLDAVFASSGVLTGEMEPVPGFDHRHGPSGDVTRAVEVAGSAL